MGVIKRGILGGFKGRVANVVGSSWKGVAYMKSLPLSVSNPNTAGQQTQRGKFGQAVEFAKSILTACIKPLWDRWAQQMSGYNAFIKENIDNFDATDLDTPEDLIIASGVIDVEPVSAVVFHSSDDTVAFQWTDNSGSGNKLATDELYIVCYNATTKSVGAVATGIARSVEAYDDVANIAIGTGNVCHLYTAFRRADGSEVSDSTHNEHTAVL